MANEIETTTTKTKKETPEKKKLKLFDWILLVLAIVYTVIPVDLIPDILPILGWSDDAIALLVAVLNIIRKIIHR